MGSIENDMAVCVIQDKIPCSKGRGKIVLHLDLTAPVQTLYDAVAKSYGIPVNSFQLYVENSKTTREVPLEAMKSQSLGETGFIGDRNLIMVSDKAATDEKPVISESEEAPVVFSLCVIRDMTIESSQTARTNLRMASNATVKRLFEVVGQTLSYDPNTFDLLLQRSGGRDVVCLKESSLATLTEAGLDFAEEARNMLVVTDKTKTPIRRTEDKERPSEVVVDYHAPITPMRSVTQTTAVPADIRPSVSFIKPEPIGYVGLVNQAMTCYLNSLLQTLYMTPEFRNALYRWQFDGNREESVKSIPFQLQKLFVKLQTSSKNAVETTELTRSFGWDSSEAWQQHDIQELCRVMFDALEQKFNNTDQADLIARLYEGKMIDYVKCLDCRTEKMREDTFLDIPLPVRPFGSAVAYASVEEALRAFVQPELLDGNNQYFCDKCGHKCDAHKGLKFSRFPYLLTLHLKRFDFDYNTLHRIKLNDKVTFPEILDLNGFIETAHTAQKNTEISASNGVNHIDEDCTVPHEPHVQKDDDEGVEVDAETAAAHARENEKNRLQAMEKGPYVYELFSIMIHSGSASGGHYYAYVKDFGNGEWFCFNDMSVTRITYDDIRRTYGGYSTRSYYSGAYSSSTNAYMLMYRQVDKSRNVNFTAKEEFPPHIQGLLQRMENEEESERLAREKERNSIRTRLFCHHPTKGRVDLSFAVDKNISVQEATSLAHEELQLSGVVPLEQCRLVKYDELSDSPECSFENREEETVGEVLANEKASGPVNLLLEIVPAGQSFVVYRSGESTVKIYVVDLETEDVGEPITLRVALDMPVAQLKEEIAVSLGTTASKLRLVLRSSQCSASLLLHDDKALKWTGFGRNNEVFVDLSGIPDVEPIFLKSILYRAIVRFENTIEVQVQLPHIDTDDLSKMGIPLTTPAHISDALSEKVPFPWPAHEQGDSPEMLEDSSELENLERRRAYSEGEHDGEDCRSTSPQPASGPSSENEDEGIGDTEDGVLHSASEEASLADSDKTLLGDPPEDSCRAPSRPNSPDDKELHSDVKDEMKMEDMATMKHIKITQQRDAETNHDVATVRIDRRLRLSALKWFLGSHLGVHADYLRIYRIQTATGLEKECISMIETIESCGENPKLVVRLGRALKPGEVRGKVYLLTLNDPEPTKYLFEWVIRPGLTVGEAKKEIIEEAKTHHDLNWNTQDCVLRRKNWRNPAYIYHDCQVFGTDIAIYTNWEMFFQKIQPHQNLDELAKAELTIFTRRWRPSQMVLEPFFEISLANAKGQTLKEKLSEISGIPVENVAVAKCQGTFPCETSVLNIPSKLTWLTEIQEVDEWPLNVSEDGAVLVYKDNQEALKVMSEEERNELANKEKVRLNQNEFPTTTSISSTRKERGLKIYVEPNTTNVTGETS